MKNTTPKSIALVSPVILTFLAVFPASAVTTLSNPLGEGITNPDQIIANIISTFLGLVGGIALIIFIWGGFLMLTSAGSPERTKKGRETLMWATLGLIIIFGSYGITQTVFTAITG